MQTNQATNTLSLNFLSIESRVANPLLVWIQHKQTKNKHKRLSNKRMWLHFEIDEIKATLIINIADVIDRK